MFHKISTLIILFTTLSVTSVSASQCKNRKDIVEPCYETRGRLQAANGNPSLRIWKVGTKRILGIREGGYDSLPSPVKEKVSFSNYIFGDYLVCPLTKEKAGHMQVVCVESVKNIRVEKIVY